MHSGYLPTLVLSHRGVDAHALKFESLILANALMPSYNFINPKSEE